MASYMQRLTPKQRAYNQALNEYLDHPSERALENLKIAHAKSGIEDTTLMNDIDKNHKIRNHFNHLAKQELKKMAPQVRIKEFTKTSTQSYLASTINRVKEFIIQCLMTKARPVVASQRERVGLRNLGNTCFGNATLQAFILSAPEMDVLLTTPLVKRAKESNKHHSSRVDLQTNLRALKDEYQRKPVNETRVTQLLKKIWSSDILKSAGLRSMSAQEDAHEFLVTVLDNLDADKHPSLSYIEHSALQKPDECPSINTSGIFQAISVEVDPKKSTLQNTFTNFFRKEQVRCNKIMKEKRIFISSASKDGTSPRSLAVQLRRFVFDGISKKVKTPIRGFKEPIKVPFSDKNGALVKHGVYQVDSVVCHFGDTPENGHYVTIVRTESGHWEEHNDSCVRSISEERALATIENSGYLIRMSWVKDV